MGIVAFSLCREKDVQVKFVEFSLLGDLADAVRQAIGHQDHAGQGAVGIVVTAPVFLCPLLIGVGPVINLLLDEFAGVDGPEGRAGEVEVETGRDREPGFVHGVPGLFFLILLHIEIAVRLFIGIVKELFGPVTPGAEMVLVKDDEVPVDCMNKFVFRLDAAGFIGPQQVLEGAEDDNGPGFVGLGILLVDIQVVVMGVLI